MQAQASVSQDADEASSVRYSRCGRTARQDRPARWCRRDLGLGSRATRSSSVPAARRPPAWLSRLPGRVAAAAVCKGEGRPIGGRDRRRTCERTRAAAPRRQTWSTWSPSLPLHVRRPTSVLTASPPIKLPSRSLGRHIVTRRHIGLVRGKDI
jgi:hypothetical protein